MGCSKKQHDPDDLQRLRALRLIDDDFMTVCFNDYVEGEPAKEYFTLDEIRELEPKILESLKIINEAKGNNK